MNQGQLNEKSIEVVVDNQKGNFTQVPNEMLDYLAQADLTKREARICIFLVRQLTGWDYEFRPIEISDFIDGTKIIKQNIVPALASLEEKKVIKKLKIPGYRTPLYGFNRELIKRVVVTSEPRKFFRGTNGKVIDLMTFKVINSMPLEVIESMTEKKRLAAVGAASQAPKDPLNTVKDKISKDLRDFLLTQRKQNRDRWEAILTNVLKDYPNDEPLLWTAIELVHRTRQDLFGKPIKRSILGLFEGDWGVIRVAMQAKLNQMEMEALRARKREENERQLQGVKAEVLPLEKPTSELDPKWARFATLKSIEK